MTNIDTGVAAGTGNLDDILGAEPVAEPLEEEVKEEPKAEPKEEPKKEDKQERAEVKEEEPREKKFSHGALHEERERRKEAQRLAKDEKERNDRLEERQNKLMEALAGRSPAQDEYADPLLKLENQFNELKGGIQKTQQQVESENKAFAEEQRLVNRYKGSIEAYKQDAPDILDARSYLIDDKIKELKALEYTEEEIAHEVKRIEKQIVERAYKQEKNPAEIIHKLAKEKGYKPKEPDKKIEDIDRGLKASKSLGTGGGVTNEGDLKSLSSTDLAEMSDEEFNALFSKLEKQSKKRA